MHEEAAKPTTDLSRWEHLFEEQSSIFRAALSRSVELEREAEELRRELGVWKTAFKAVEDDHRETKKTVARLERSIEAMKDDNPLLTCLIDGDGTIFSQELWVLGRSGGRQAASLLTKGLTEHAASLDENISSRCQIWLSIYCNKKGLMDTLVSSNICTNEQFEDFIHGFNEASPLFSIVDVGSGKEAADAKIKEYLRSFTKFPQVIKVYLGGTHDNGYSTTVNHLINEGFGNKLILLKGYKSLAAELKNANLPQLEIEGLFMSQKLNTNQHPRLPPSPPKKQLLDFEKFKSMAKIEEHPPAPILRRFDPTLLLKQHKPQPCSWFYVTKCKSGNKCRFAHDYERTPELLHAVYAQMKLTPCSSVAKDRPCNTIGCIYGHYCPYGPRCSQHKAGNCKFTGRESHKPQISAGFPSFFDARASVIFGSTHIVDDQSDALSTSSRADSQERESNSSYGSRMPSSIGTIPFFSGQWPLVD